jgi:hypothetical protein
MIRQVIVRSHYDIKPSSAAISFPVYTEAFDDVDSVYEPEERMTTVNRLASDEVCFQEFR